jgi:hypothetical protein
MFYTLSPIGGEPFGNENGNVNDHKLGEACTLPPLQFFVTSALIAESMGDSQW